MKQIKLTLSFCFMLVASFVFAQDSDNSCSDYPMLTHLDSFAIINCSKLYNSYDIPVGEEKFKSVEGMVYNYYYGLSEKAGEDYRISWLQLHRNFENAVRKAGGTVIFLNEDGESFHMVNKDKELYVHIQPDGGNSDEGYSGYLLHVVEKQAMKQEVDAKGIFDALSTDGHIALQINFETGKAAITPESQKIIDQIYQMLIENPGLRISIEGHTDNTGDATSNQTLSANRAKAVVEALVAKGIDRSRITSRGWGATKPVADNSTEEGRAANRRVEIVKL